MPYTEMCQGLPVVPNTYGREMKVMLGRHRAGSFMSGVRNIQLQIFVRTLPKPILSRAM
jgi:hypothetical protein